MKAKAFLLGIGMFAVLCCVAVAQVSVSVPVYTPDNCCVKLDYYGCEVCNAQLLCSFAKRKGGLKCDKGDTFYGCCGGTVTYKDKYATIVPGPICQPEPGSSCWTKQKVNVPVGSCITTGRDEDCTKNAVVDGIPIGVRCETKPGVSRNSENAKTVTTTVCTTGADYCDPKAKGDPKCN
jgi:hypothetical protein